MVFGHENVRQYLGKSWKRGTVSHGYFLHGPRHVGKTMTALSFAKTLLCEEGKHFGGCGVCAACLHVIAFMEPRCITLQPGLPILSKVERDKNEIGIEEIREVRKRLSYSALGWQIVLILDAEKLSREASNALLKILEEPGRNTVFLFVSSRPAYVLPTITSRLLRLRFSFVSDDALRSVPGATLELLALALGRPGVLVRMMEDDASRKRQAEWYRLAEEISSGSYGKALALSEKIAENTEAREEVSFYLLRLLQKQYRKKMPDYSAMSSRHVFHALDVMAASETMNVNRRLAVDIICMNLSGFASL
ncbi:MAG: hypothetical protein HY471_01760 [Candidatus Sungbacteria bacterium]|nr:hypothetical protein [Candidatus Sungbacteria bacterium]